MKLETVVNESCTGNITEDTQMNCNVTNESCVSDTTENVQTSNTTEDNRTKYVSEALKLIESEDIKEHILNELKDFDDETYLYDTLGPIIVNAPIPLEQKLSILNLLPADERTYLPLFELDEACREIENALDERYSGQDNNTKFKLYMYNQPKESFVQFSKFDEAVNYIKQAEKTDYDVESVNEIDKCYDYGKTNIIEKWVLNKFGNFELYLYWFLDDTGNILYYEYSKHPTVRTPKLTPGQLRFSVPFKSGDIIEVDCSPFAEKKRVLILENNDIPDFTTEHGVLCLFIVDSGADSIKLDAGYFKLNEFLDYPKNNYVSALYHTKIYKGELTEDEAQLSILSKAIKINSIIGRLIFRIIKYYKELFIVSRTNRNDKYLRGIELNFLIERLGKLWPVELTNSSL